MLIDVECGIFCERGEKSHGNKIMEFETGRAARGSSLCWGSPPGRPGLSAKRFCSGNLLMEQRWEKFSQRASDP